MSTTRIPGGIPPSFDVGQVLIPDIPHPSHPDESAWQVVEAEYRHRTGVREPSDQWDHSRGSILVLTLIAVRHPDD